MVAVARPLLLFTVLLAVFTHVFHFGSKVPHYPAFCCSTSSCSVFSQEATTIAVVSIVGHEAVVRKTQFPRLVIPLAVVCTTLFNLALNLIVAFVFIILLGVSAVVDLAAAAADRTRAVHLHDRGVDDRAGALSAVPRRGDHLAVFAMALFYATPVLYPLQSSRATCAT